MAKKGLAKSLGSHLKNITKECGLPIILYDETKQSGSDFGSRFSNALQDVYNEGYDAVITIGNDSPHLETRHINQAQEQLLNGNTVIGPTFDGGFYLLGIAKEDFDRTAFLNFSWNTEAIYEEISQTFSNKEYSISVLQKLWDIDYFSDIKQLNVTTISNISLRQVIQNINSLSQDNYKNTTLYTFHPLFAIPFNKGSPSAIIFY